MRRLCIICEGQTEGDFVKACLVPHLSGKGIIAYPSLLKTRPGKQGGGAVSIPRIARHIRNEYRNSDFITTFVDFFGFSNKDENSRDELEAALLEESKREIGEGFENRWVMPYIQMHEFEGLLFSDICKFELLGTDFDWNGRIIEELQNIRNQFQTPEDINDSSLTAPSKRLDSVFPGYKNAKRIYGPLVAEDIGLDKIRRECPLFNEWVGMMEQLGEVA